MSPTPAAGTAPTEEEVAAIIAAIEVAWPRPAQDSGPRADLPVWRFSGRWWSRPVPARRERPWVAPGS